MPLKGKITNVHCGTYTCTKEGELSMLRSGSHTGEEAFELIDKFTDAYIEPDSITLTIELSGEQIYEPKIQLIFQEFRREQDIEVNITLA